MTDILAEAESLTDERSRLIVNVDVEGEECEIVLGTPADAWSAVSELFVEMHTWAPCTAADLVKHLSPDGFSELRSEMVPVLRLRREAGPRFGLRTAPT